MSNVTKFRQKEAATLTDHGAVFSPDITEAQHLECGKQLASAEKRMQWAQGDWYNAIKWGDKAAKCAEAGLDYKNVKNYGSVCSKYQMSFRSDIPFKHHVVLGVEALTDKQRQALLKRAESEGLSTKALKIERDKLLGTYVEPVTDDDTLEGFIDAVTDNVPQKYKGKVKAAVETLNSRLVSEFNAAVSKKAKALAKKEQERLKAYRKELDERDAALTKAFKKVNHLLTITEFKQIRSCLHPDRDCTPAQKQKAFTAFQKLLDNVDPAARKRWGS